MGSAEPLKAWLDNYVYVQTENFPPQARAGSLEFHLVVGMDIRFQTINLLDFLGQVTRISRENNAAGHVCLSIDSVA